MTERRRKKLTGPLVALAAIALTPAVGRAADPTTADCLGAHETALKLQGDHRLREARAQLLVCATATCPSDIRNECTRLVSEVNTAIPTIVFEVKDGAGNDLTGVRAWVDGKGLTEHLEGIAISLDPGDHVFVFEAPGLPPIQKTIVLREGEKDRRERIVIGATAQRAEAPAPAAPAAEGSTWSGQKTLALVVGGVGLGGVVVGTVFGLNASSSWSSSKSSCPSVTNCPNRPQALMEHDSAQTSATISTITFGVGIAALAGAAVLWFTAPSGQAAAPPRTGLRLTPMAGRTNGLAIDGVF